MIYVNIYIRYIIPWRFYNFENTESYSYDVCSGENIKSHKKNHIFSTRKHTFLPMCLPTYVHMYITTHRNTHIYTYMNAHICTLYTIYTLEKHISMTSVVLQRTLPPWWKLYRHVHTFLPTYLHTHVYNTYNII